MALSQAAMSSGFEEQRLSEYDSATLARYILASEPSEASFRVFFLSPNLIAKQYLRGDDIGMLEALHLATFLGVRVPCVKRTIEANDNVYVIMDRIWGQTLEEAWARLNWFTTLRLAFQLRVFVRRMRARTSPTAGSLTSGTCTSIWLDDYYGLPSHASPASIKSFIRFWLNFVPPSRRRPAKQHPKEFVSRHHVPLVFTHQDLAPRNMVVDKNSRLWLLDWDDSGWYPVYFEYASMQNFDTPSTWTWTDRLRWKSFSWFTVGHFPKERKALKQTRMRFTRFPLGRKNEVLQEGAPAHAAHLRKPGM